MDNNFKSVLLVLLTIGQVISLIYISDLNSRVYSLREDSKQKIFPRISDLERGYKENMYTGDEALQKANDLKKDVCKIASELEIDYDLKTRCVTL